MQYSLHTIMLEVEDSNHVQKSTTHCYCSTVIQLSGGCSSPAGLGYLAQALCEPNIAQIGVPFLISVFQLPKEYDFEPNEIKPAKFCS